MLTLRLLLTAVFVCIGSASFAQAPANWDQLVAAAKKEGKVVFFSGYVGEPTNKAIAEGFRKKYGIDVEYLEFRGLELRERIRVEQAAGRFTVDLMHNAQTQTQAARDQEKSLQPIGALPNTPRIRKPFEANEFWVPIFTINYGFLINKNLIKGDDEPTSWLDLLKPQWKGKILSDDVRTAGGGYVMFFATYDAFGRDFHEKLAAQGLNFTRDYREAARRVARGEFPIYIPYILSDFKNVQALPLKYIVPKEGASYGAYAASILKNAPHPNAARLLADYYLSDEGQEIYANSGHGVVVAGIADKISPDARAISDIKLLGTNFQDRADEMYAKAKEIYK
jgi:iron(III) transport system substrate-binding protein